MRFVRCNPLPQMRPDSFTADQIRAIENDGNVLVLAGAGTGKTRTLVERCVVRLLNPRAPARLEQMLLVTFTEAAAAEMKRRIRIRLEEELTTTQAMRAHIEGELASLDRAHISTLHSFCLRMVRDHFHELQLDPQLTVLTEVQRRLLMDDVLDQLLREHFESGTEFAEAVEEVLTLYGRGAERSIHELLFKLHEYTQTRANPNQWLAAQRKLFAAETPAQWAQWFAVAYDEWRTRWIGWLRSQPTGNPRAREFAGIVEKFADRPKSLFEAIRAADEDWDGTKTIHRRPIEEFFREAAFLDSLVDAQGGHSPLEDDWRWARRPMQTLLRLITEFSERFARRKQGEGYVDFSDFEQYASRLLLGDDASSPTPLAKHYRERFRWILVDECQDINPSQDAILRALSGEEAGANRFLVGDVKQSIYRFRLADPRIFQQYQAEWRRPEAGTVVALSENFRSRKALLEFVNSAFETLMRRELGGVHYDADAQLRFAALDERLLLAGTEPAVELHLALRMKSGDENAGSEEEVTAAELSDAEREARVVARRLRELQESGFQIWNKDEHRLQAAQWKDMVILLRAPAQKVEIYARAFHDENIPFQAQGSGFYDSMEILDLICLLQFLHNPFDDVSALAVLRSPFVGLTLDELADIRTANRKEPYWLALKRWHEITKQTHATFAKVDKLLEQFARWRQMARTSAISHRLEAILAETHYWEWLLTQDRASQRRNNVERFLALAQQFDPLQRLGLQRFLRFIETQKEAEQEREPLPVDHPNAVQLMSIHQSKGLEFPIVVVPDLGKAFNTRDLFGQVLIDEELGLCPRIQPPGMRGKYPSLPWWMAGQRQKPELLGEELRLLYVAFTRAQDRLLLVGSASAKRLGEKWPELASRAGEEHVLASAASYLDWLGPVFSREGLSDAPEGTAKYFTWRLHRGGDTTIHDRPGAAKAKAESPAVSPDCLTDLVKKFEWSYPHTAATTISAKQSATGLAGAAGYKAADEAQQMFAFAPTIVSPRFLPRKRGNEGLSAAEIGVAHHRFLHLINLKSAGSEAELAQEAERMLESGALGSDERAALDIRGVFSFWKSSLGQKVIGGSKFVHREIPFTARFSAADLQELKIALPAGLRADEFFIVRGIVDLAVILEKEIWIVDFKTDAMREEDLGTALGTYASQLKVYGLALSRIYRRPTTERYLHFLSLNKTVKT